jgi:superfamily II DNA/RNA helicase
MLDRIEDMLRELNINYCRLDGTMTREQRAQAMEDLKTKRSIEVMLVSTRAGGVGLNLTSACRAYLIDPYWNPSVEAQAIDRVHRMGQKQPVTAVRLMIKTSVEEKLAQIQKKKADLANLSLKNMTRKELMEQKVSTEREDDSPFAFTDSSRPKRSPTCSVKYRRLDATLPSSSVSTASLRSFSSPSPLSSFVRLVSGVPSPIMSHIVSLLSSSAEYVPPSPSLCHD